ncbi:MAG: SDR family oxidoreductase [Actinobacteria bacterium]|nr:SDR family oxidoreductase [Actinomycetota bacterium]
MTTLAVTGATGRVGGRVARRLADAGVEQRLIVRDPERAPELANTEIAVADYAEAAASRAALDGIETLFMVSGSEAHDRVEQHRTFVDAAADAGVVRIVYLSFYGAAPDSTFTLGRDHWATEQHIRERGLTWTFLRDNLYLDFFPFMAGDDGVIRGPAGDGRVAAVAIDDVADVAAEVLLDIGPHASTTYRLTGPDSFTLAEASAIMSQVLDRSFRYHQETVEEAYDSRAIYGAPDWQVEAWVTTYTAIAAGDLAEVTDDVARVTGHPPRSLRDILADHGDRHG